MDEELYIKTINELTLIALEELEDERYADERKKELQRSYGDDDDDEYF